MADVALGRAVYANLCQMWREVGRAAGGRGAFDVQSRPDMLLIRSTYAQRVPHMVLDPHVPDARAAAWTAQLVGELGTGPTSLMIGIPPGREDGVLVTALRAEGFQAESRPKIAMTASLADAVPGGRDAMVTEARTARDLAEARELLGTIFGLPIEVFAFYTPPDLVSTYVLRWKGKPLAAVCLCPFAGCAGIYSVGVLPHARGHGYARQVVAYALAEAAGRGLKTAVLSCERQLAPLYRLLGFETCWELRNYWLEAWWR